MSMPADDYIDRRYPPRRAPTRARLDRALLRDLVAVLQGAPKGLRRWSVMRALRDRRLRAGHDITPKFEDEVERLFRAFCMGEAASDGGGAAPVPSVKPFFRPKETAGEVWAVDPDRLAAFLASEGEAV